MDEKYYITKRDKIVTTSEGMVGGEGKDPNFYHKKDRSSITKNIEVMERQLEIYSLLYLIILTLDGGEDEGNLHRG